MCTYGIEWWQNFIQETKETHGKGEEEKLSHWEFAPSVLFIDMKMALET